MLPLVLFKVMSASSGRDQPGAAAAHRFVCTHIFPRNHVPISLTLKAILLSVRVCCNRKHLPQEHGILPITSARCCGDRSWGDKEGLCPYLPLPGCTEGPHRAIPKHSPGPRWSTPSWQRAVQQSQAFPVMEAVGSGVTEFLLAPASPCSCQSCSGRG